MIIRCRIPIALKVDIEIAAGAFVGKLLQATAKLWVVPHRRGPDAAKT